MTRTWLTIRVELGSGRSEYYWPRPGPIFVARRSFTFRQLADAINLAFGRWELAHLHRFVLGDGTEIVPVAWWDEVDDDAADDATTTLSRLQLGDQFAYEFDLGDGWEHLCTVGPERVDPTEVYGPAPDDPAPYFGWGDLPDQHGRQWGSDDGSATPPPAPDPPTSDLPPLLPSWGDRPEPVATLLHGLPALRDWDADAYAALRGAVYRGGGQAVMDLLVDRVAAEAAQLVGDGLLLAVEQDVAGATDLARELAEDLRGQFDLAPSPSRTSSRPPAGTRKPQPSSRYPWTSGSFRCTSSPVTTSVVAGSTSGAGRSGRSTRSWSPTSSRTGTSQTGGWTSPRSDRARPGRTCASSQARSRTASSASVCFRRRRPRCLPCLPGPAGRPPRGPRRLARVRR